MVYIASGTGDQRLRTVVLATRPWTEFRDNSRHVFRGNISASTWATSDWSDSGVWFSKGAGNTIGEVVDFVRTNDYLRLLNPILCGL